MFLFSAGVGLFGNTELGILGDVDSRKAVTLTFSKSVGFGIYVTRVLLE